LAGPENVTVALNPSPFHKAQPQIYIYIYIHVPVHVHVHVHVHVQVPWEYSRSGGFPYMGAHRWLGSTTGVLVFLTWGWKVSSPACAHVCARLPCACACACPGQQARGARGASQGAKSQPESQPRAPGSQSARSQPARACWVPVH